MSTSTFQEVEEDQDQLHQTFLCCVSGRERRRDRLLEVQTFAERLIQLRQPSVAYTRGSNVKLEKSVHKIIFNELRYLGCSRLLLGRIIFSNLGDPQDIQSILKMRESYVSMPPNALNANENNAADQCDFGGVAPAIRYAPT